MPNKKAAIKHLRQTEKRTRKNFLVKRNIKEIIKKGQKAVLAGNGDKTKELAKVLQKAVDKAIKAGVLKPNTGNRKKARFAVAVNKASNKQTAEIKK